MDTRDKTAKSVSRATHCGLRTTNQVKPSQASLKYHALYAMQDRSCARVHQAVCVRTIHLEHMCQTSRCARHNQIMCAHAIIEHACAHNHPHSPNFTPNPNHPRPRYIGIRKSGSPTTPPGTHTTTKEPPQTGKTLTQRTTKPGKGSTRKAGSPFPV